MVVVYGKTPFLRNTAFVTLQLTDGHDSANRWWPITDEGVAAGGAFDSDTATGVMQDAQRVAGRASVLAIVIHRQEVSPMNAVSAVGAPLQCTIARLR